MLPIDAAVNLESGEPSEGDLFDAGDPVAGRGTASVLSYTCGRLPRAHQRDSIYILCTCLIACGATIHEAKTSVCVLKVFNHTLARYEHSLELCLGQRRRWDPTC